MSDQVKRLAELRQTIFVLEIEYARAKAQGQAPFVLSTQWEMVRNHVKLAEQIESELLRERAAWWGIEIPNKPEWQEIELISEFGIDGKTGTERDQPIVTFNEKGRAIITRQIREAQLSYLQKWVAVLTPLLSLLLSVLSVIVAILALSRK
jgi:hypothetical protein